MHHFQHMAIALLIQALSVLIRTTDSERDYAFLKTATRSANQSLAGALQDKLVSAMQGLGHYGRLRQISNYPLEVYALQSVALSLSYCFTVLIPVECYNGQLHRIFNESQPAHAMVLDESLARVGDHCAKAFDQTTSIRRRL